MAVLVVESQEGWRGHKAWMSVAPTSAVVIDLAHMMELHVGRVELRQVALVFGLQQPWLQPSLLLA
jgi:hypothetical protein